MHASAGALAGTKRPARSESPPGALFVPRKRRTPAVGAHSAAASGATHMDFPSAPAAVAVHASSGAGAGAEGALSLARAPPPALAKARSGDNLDAWQARCRASSGAAGASSDYGNAPVQDLTARPLRRSERFQVM